MWFLGVVRMRSHMNYRSSFEFLGLPFLHIASGKIGNGRYKRGIAKGWIAIGDISCGILLSVGGIAVGGIALGGLGIGIVSLAGLALGVLALGGGAIGFASAGGGAVAWYAAYGGLAVAQEYALGGAAFAAHANDQAAKDFFHSSSLFSTASVIMDHARWLLLLLLIPVFRGLIDWKKRRDSREKPKH